MSHLHSPALAPGASVRAAQVLRGLLVEMQAVETQPEAISSPY
ncbi:MAG TPA: hypothetical protein VNA23_02285 [Anaerolineales bacterium]|nr:hypothetical protein [Anaerolineales bacterium]